MSIHPRFAKEIIAGTKRVEFRKRALRSDVEYVIIYATSPVKRVLGYFKVGQIDSGSPAQMWQRHCSVGRNAADAFWRYFKHAEGAFAIEVIDARGLDAPCTLPELGHHGPPPQSYCYLPGAVLERVRTPNH